MSDKGKAKRKCVSKEAVGKSQAAAPADADNAEAKMEEEKNQLLSIKGMITPNLTKRLKDSDPEVILVLSKLYIRTQLKNILLWTKYFTVCSATNNSTLI